MKSIKHSNQKGFTIIELLIATSVFSIVLVVAASGILAIGRLYYKGITSSRTQETTRSVVNTITNTVQFNSQSRADDEVADTVGVPQAVCFGYDRYTYTLVAQVDSGTPGLLYDRRPNLNNCDPYLGGKELLPNNMRLVNFKIDSLSSNNFKVKVKITAGDIDLLELTQCSGSIIDGKCNNPSIEDAATIRCQPGIAGSNFCAVSELETTINKRVE